MNRFNLVCWNCRGISSGDISNRAHNFIRKFKPLIVCFVETKANEDRVYRFCQKLPADWDWAAILADGFSGGIIVAWNKIIGTVSPVVSSRRALHLVISNNVYSNCLISVIYNASNSQSQRNLWYELSKLSAFNIPWFLIGDFNAITSSEEHRGGSFAYYSRKALNFLNFIEANNLLDLQFSGPKYTWCNNQSGVARRWAMLDRGLINLAWSSLFGSYTLRHLPRLHSDHAPLLFSGFKHISNHKSSFRFENYWIDYIGCHNAVHSAWDFHPYGNPIHAFTHLLARSRSKIIDWRASGLSNLDADIINTENAITSLEVTDSLNADDLPVLEEMYAKLTALQRLNSKKWSQRARMQWIRDGDMNTKFFHNINAPVGTSTPFLKFEISMGLLSLIDVLAALPDDLPCLSSVDCDFLSREVSREEIHMTVLDLPSGKSPGPDGFNAEFYKFFWADIGDQLTDAIQYFFANSIMPFSWGKTFISLIPKKDNPSSVSDYRPISLCNVCYKVISKILANRLKLVLPKLIGREQVGFVVGRCAFDNIIALQEVVHSLEKDYLHPPRMLIKIDIEKAYDTVSWNAILATLTKMNFPSSWISWISACLHSTSFSLLINGQPSPWFKSCRGIRHGDPLSSFLFIIVSQNLTSILNHAQNLGMIPGFCNLLKYNFNHLMYADDLILITHASRRIARNINLCLSIYSNISGQCPNVNKSAVFFPSWFNSRVTKSISSILNFNIASFPLTYLGVFVSPKRLAKQVFNSMVIKITRQCSRWNQSFLSPAAKVVLINYSLLSIPIYYLSVCPVYDTTLQEINRVVRRFFWHKGSNRNGIPAVAWDDITRSKTEGGLAIRNLIHAKHSLMAKNILHYYNYDDFIWVDILHVKYGGNNSWVDVPPAQCSWFFKGLLSSAHKLRSCFWIKTVNPNKTSLLYHPWCLDIPLAFKPTYINSDLDLQSMNLCDFLCNDSWDWNKLFMLFGENFLFFTNKLGVIDCRSSNHWVWSPKSGSSKLASSVYHFLNHNHNWVGWKKLWELNVAPRVKHFIWLVFRGRISTSEYLYSIGLGPRNACALCGLKLETIDHLFVQCPRAIDVWTSVCQKLNISISFLDGFRSGSWITFDGHSLFIKSVIAGL
ncbi:uncharacterized protein LOC120276159 [Dioscorea cayenensis subsp. rotundata]|uniref:Uncharacterized protein LOC120276159 n=1 Tax=Dioscorea cayennensis subsp. rotundata TaxID=55577 RepID=A0AB40CJL7_DIOCR|nr:uncharacterized protein LOC120276159 [Dioscorea cayenensis subsp. rotundata]